MIVVLFRVILGISVLLAVVIIAGLVYPTVRSFRSSRRLIRQTVVLQRADKSEVRMPIGAEGYGDPRIRVKFTYSRLRQDISRFVINPIPKGFTEREYILSLSTEPRFTRVKNQLQGLYGLYEEARFGRRPLTTDEVEEWAGHVRGVYESLGLRYRTAG